MKTDLKFRRMELSDREGVRAICMKLWGEGDFLIRQFDEFVQDRKGEFTAVEHDGKLIAVAKLTYLSDTDAWLQGLRKDADVDLHGVGSAITQHYIDLAGQNMNLTSLRFTTYMKNYRSRALNEKLGFYLAKMLSMKNSVVGPTASSAAGDPSVSSISDASIVLDYIHKSEYFKLTDNNVNLDWIVYRYNDDFIKSRFIDSGECFGIVEENELKALALTYAVAKRLILSFFDADSFEHASRLMKQIHKIAKDSERDTIMIFRPDSDKLKEWFTRMYFKSWECEHDFLLYEYPIDKLREK